ncbi:MAG: RlmF-related methyltransferase, partial [Shewanella sp.]
VKALPITSEPGKAALNFGGQAAELWCEGGERQFLARMIAQSQGFASQCLWFTSLVSKQDNLRPCYQALGKLGVDTVKTIEMQQGNKITRVLAWSFLSPAKRQQWRREWLGANAL